MGGSGHRRSAWVRPAVVAAVLAIPAVGAGATATLATASRGPGDIRPALRAVGAATGAPHAAAASPHGLPASPSSFPNDPDFAGCEAQDPVTGCTDDEQWDLYGTLTGNTCLDPGGTVADKPHPDGGLPCWARNATDPQHAAGLNFTGAWQQGNVGRDDVRIAYIEGGVNYRVSSIKDGLNSIWLNRRELPYPELADGRSAGRYDADGNGRLDIRDYARDPRVNPACAPGVAPFVTEAEGTTHGCVAGGTHPYLNSVPVAGTLTPYLSPEDLIVAFGHCRIERGAIRSCPAGGRFDNDGNGYPNDVSGWNFERNTNDPQTDNLGYSHASGLISLLGGQPNNAYAGVGACRTCRVVPIKQGAEAIGRSDKWAEAVLYAADLGVTAISSVVVEYNYSSLSQRAVDYAYRRGVLLSLDSNDFDSMDHSDGMLFNHAIPGNSLALDKPGAAAQTFRARSNVTSYGTHNIFSGGEVTTSGATPFMAATLAMVQSAALSARDRGRIPSRLTPDEVKQVLMDTASPVIPQTQAPHVARQWPGNPRSATDPTHTNWSTQYGYGRPDVGAATRLVLSGQVPPTAELSSPRWFAYVDPVRQSRLVVTGRLAPSRWRSRGVRWTLEAAPGADPADSDFRAVSRGRGARDGRLGTLDLRRFRSLARRAPGDTLPPDGPERYTVTLRLRVRDGNGLKAEDRRTFGARHDPALLAGYPRHVSGEIAAAPAYVDLEGRRQNDLVFATYDGVVHALRPDGSEVPGFPVGSDALRAIDRRNPQNYPARAYRDPELRDARDPLTGVAVGDLFGDGRLEVVATSSNAVVYAWDARGRRLRGFPRTSDPRWWSLPVPTPDAPTRHGRLPARGNWSPPVLADLEGDGRLDVLMTAYDGFVYAWRPNGQPVPGWPVEVKLPDGVLARDGIAPADYIRDSKLVAPVGVADVLGTGRPQVFVPSFECGDDRTAWLYGIWPDGNRHAGGPFLPRWPVALPSLSMCYDNSIDFVSEGPTAPVFGKVDSSGRTRVISAAPTGPTAVIDGDGNVVRQLSPACPGAACAANPPYRPGDPFTVTLTGQPALSDLTGVGRPQVAQSQVGAISISTALDQEGQAALPQVYTKAWDGGDGSILPGFPARQDGFPFYTAPVSADLGGAAGKRAVVESNDSYWVHAFLPGGGEAPGFPKYTGQWPSFSGVVSDPRMDGRLTFATGSREGDVFVWRTAGDAARNDQWWHFRHDERNTGDYALDTRRPAVVTGLRAGPGGALSWRAPGGDGQLGRAARYEVRLARAPIASVAAWRRGRVAAGAPEPAAAGTRQGMRVAAPGGGHWWASVIAIDAAGNRSAAGSAVRLR